MNETIITEDIFIHFERKKKYLFIWIFFLHIEYSLYFKGLNNLKTHTFQRFLYIFGMQNLVLFIFAIFTQ